MAASSAYRRRGDEQQARAPYAHHRRTRSRTAAPRRHRPQTEERPGRPEHQDRYEPHLDGLFTYCLSVLCEHDAAAVVLGETLALAERQYGRRPGDPALFRPWLYALVRWACLRRLTEQAAPDAVAHPTPHGRRPGSANSPRWPGRRRPAPLPSSARCWSWRCATGSHRRRSPR
ncbi:hypothetical protein O1L55_07310 [Streptomyces albulus]|nr:hypothetical protein [Streptomyces noursei]